MGDKDDLTPEEERALYEMYMRAQLMKENGLEDDEEYGDEMPTG